MYLSDFGIAKSDVAASLTEPGKVVGTPAMMMAHLFTSPPPLTARRPDLPRAADDVLAKAMAKDPDKRYASCGLFAAALREALGVLPYRPRGSATASAPPLPTSAPSRSAQMPPFVPGMPTGPMTGPELVMGPEPVTAPDPMTADELYRELRGSTGKPARRPRMTARRRRQLAWMFPAGLSAAVMVAVIALVLVAHTGHSATPGHSHATANSADTFAGYTGQQGSVTVSSITWADGSWLAAGRADDHPAIWRRAASGAWTLVSAAGTMPGELTGIAHGKKGWIAAGNTATQPVVMTSADGVTWQVSTTALPGPDPIVTGAAAGPNGYVVVGHLKGKHTYAAMWWSADLRRWAQGNNDTFDGSKNASAVTAVAATSAGFFAAGTHGSGGVIWTSTDGGQKWASYPVTPPPRASSVQLSLVAVNGNGVAVAAGDAVIAGHGAVPIVVVRTGGGRPQYRAIELSTHGSQGTVTALAETAAGFIAAGTIGPSGAQHSVTWSLPDSLTPDWGTVPAVAVSEPEITALSAHATTMAGAAQRGQDALICQTPRVALTTVAVAGDVLGVESGVNP